LNPASSGQQERIAEFLRGITEQATVNGQPAIYVKHLVVQQQGRDSASLDDPGHALIVERSGVLVEVIRQRDAGDGRRDLEQVVASMQ